MQGDESRRGDQSGDLEAVGQLLPLPGHPPLPSGCKTVQCNLASAPG